jgi:hypothetical protein
MKNIKNIKKGQWLFTCSMQPLQFDSFEKEPNPDDYNREKFTDEEWWDFCHDGFITMEGSSHSATNCGCTPISEEYANWFIKNECWKLFPEDSKVDNVWDIYQNLVKDLCKKDNIEYEGI